MTEKKKIHKVTLNEFAYFKERVLFWQKVFGLNHVKFYIRLEKNGEKQTVADYESWPATGTIKIRLNTEVTIDFPKEEIDSTAFHEVFESTFLSDLRHMAKTSWSNYEVEMQTHKAIMLAENSIFKAMRGY